MSTLADKLNKLATPDLHRVEAIALLSMEAQRQPLAAGETFEQFLERPKRFMAAQEMLVTSAMLRTFREILDAPFTPAAEDVARFRQKILQAVQDWQRAAPSQERGRKMFGRGRR